MTSCVVPSSSNSTVGQTEGTTTSNGNVKDVGTNVVMSDGTVNIDLRAANDSSRAIDTNGDESSKSTVHEGVVPSASISFANI